MKNAAPLLRKFVILSILVFIVIACWDDKNNSSLETNEENALSIQAPKDIISLDQAATIYDNYSEHRVPLIASYEIKKRAISKKFQATRFVDFDYTMLSDYLMYVNQEATKAGVQKISKLRMYFANYPDKAKFSDGQEVKHPKQNSIFLTPTLEKDGGDYSFYIGDDGKAKLIIDWKSELQKGLGVFSSKQVVSEATMIPSFSINSSLKAAQSLILNSGNSGPPSNTEF